MIRKARACGCREESPIKQTALFNTHQHSGASLIEHHGWQVPACFSNSEDEAARVRESVGVADVSWMLKFDLKGYGLKSPLALGEGAFSWALGPLHALVTCDPSSRREVMDRFQGLQTAGADLALPPPVYVTEVTSVYAQFLLVGPRCWLSLAPCCWHGTSALLVLCHDPKLFSDRARHFDTRRNDCGDTRESLQSAIQALVPH